MDNLEDAFNRISVSTSPPSDPWMKKRPTAISPDTKRTYFSTTRLSLSAEHDLTNDIVTKRKQLSSSSSQPRFLTKRPSSERNSMPLISVSPQRISANTEVVVLSNEELQNELKDMDQKLDQYQKFVDSEIGFLESIERLFATMIS